MSQEKEYFYGLTTEPARHDRLVIFNKVIFAIVLGIALAMVVKIVRAEPFAMASVNNGQVVITVYTENCELKDTVINLPKKATWKEGGKVYQGCVGVFPDFGIAAFYFNDKTVAVIPLQMFAKVAGV